MSPKTTPRATRVSRVRGADEDTDLAFYTPDIGGSRVVSPKLQEMQESDSSQQFLRCISCQLAHFCCGPAIEMCIIRCPEQPRRHSLPRERTTDGICSTARRHPGHHRLG